MRQSPETTALIIPALDEADVIGELLDQVPRSLFKIIIVADNGSTDGTVDIARAKGAAVTHATTRGYGAACLAALAALPPEIGTIVFIQADLSEDPREAIQLVEPIWNGRADLVLGSRVDRAEPGALLPHQRFGNRLATSLIRRLYGYRYSDLSGYRAIRRSALAELEMSDRNYGWTVEMQVRALEKGLRILEVPVSYRKRAAGDNKVSGAAGASIRAGWKIISTILRLWICHMLSRRDTRPSSSRP